MTMVTRELTDVPIHKQSSHRLVNLQMPLLTVTANM